MPKLNEPADRALLFQYGSNMSEQRLRAKIREHQSYAPAGAELGVRLLGCARLTGWRFVLDLYSARQDCLVADIVEGEDGDETWGALYELDRKLLVRMDGRRSVLDRIEGHRTERDPENYRPTTVTVELGGDSREAHTYVGGVDARRRCSADHPGAKTRPDYLRAILNGAEAVGLPATYVRALATTIEGQSHHPPD
jgi:AIG2-like family